MQHIFAGNPLNRSSGTPKSADWYARVLADSSSRYLCFDGEQVLLTTAVKGEESTLCLLSLAELTAVGVRVHASTDSDSPGSVQPVVLGRRVDNPLPDRAATDAYVLALDIAGLSCGTGTSIVQSVVSANMFGQNAGQFQRIRAVLGTLSPHDAAIAGHALALLSMHRQYKFCHCCGGATELIEAGLKRRCTVSTCGFRIYPRTDPVSITIVSSPDNQRCLLGRNRGFPPGMYTALSGFVEQGESIEEGAAREVLEEAGVQMDSLRLRIHSSQPWPIGRGSACQLMIGLIGQALTDDINFNRQEMDDVRWFNRQEIGELIIRSKTDRQPSATAPAGAPSLFIPPPFAIAFHLIKAWYDSAHD